MLSNNKKEKIGKVVSNSSDKSIVVRVDRLLKHPIYGKFIKKTTKFMVHDQENISKVGDLVKIVESRPISKRKRWKLIKVLKKI